MRVYLPLLLGEVEGLVADQRLEGPRTGHAVTASLIDALPEAGVEEQEYAAAADAAMGSWERRGAGDPPRRYVLAADIDDVTPVGGSLVEVAGVVPWRSVAALLADPDDQDAEASGEDLEDVPLAWFATQEIATLIG